MSSVKQEVREYIASNFLMDTAAADFADDASFMDAHLLDSTGFLELVQFVEESYSIRVLDDEMIPDNLDSLDAIDAYVARKRGVGSAAAE